MKNIFRKLSVSLFALMLLASCQKLCHKGCNDSQCSRGTSESKAEEMKAPTEEVKKVKKSKRRSKAAEAKASEMKAPEVKAPEVKVEVKKGK